MSTLFKTALERSLRAPRCDPERPRRQPVSLKPPTSEIPSRSNPMFFACCPRLRSGGRPRKSEGEGPPVR
eukprot:7211960-Pyramimonas_sp.AAC.1